MKLKLHSFKAISLLLFVCCTVRYCQVGEAFVTPSPSHHGLRRSFGEVRQTPNKNSDNSLGTSGSSSEEGTPPHPRNECLPGPDDTTDEKIRSVFVLFNSALATRNAKIVAKRYAKDAVLLPSANGEALMDAQAIEQFYEQYLLEHPQQRMLEGRVRVGNGWAEDAGVCEISTRGGRVIKGRYSFVYVWENNQWKILHHYTSNNGLGGDMAGSLSTLAPSASSGLSDSRMTNQRVQNLFRLLQDSFEIRDADLVARRFSKDAILLPVDVYASHKYGYDQIKEYFEQFLLDKPSITRVERLLITIDSSPVQQKWAKDSGMLQLTFQTDGSTLDARYSIDYCVDDAGTWKISQFVISPLPKDWKQIRTFRRSPLWGESSPSDRKEYASSGDSTSMKVSAGGQESKSPPAVTEENVRSWFEDWNAAMTIGDHHAVASLYSPEAVLFTSASAAPKTTPQEITMFYQIFLWNRPTAKVLQSFVTISKYWCKDVGVLEYTIRGSARKIRERYSFLYIYTEAGGWKIAHHHCSMVPADLKETGLHAPGDSGDQCFQ
jgi:hypothetical protein